MLTSIAKGSKGCLKIQAFKINNTKLPGKCLEIPGKTLNESDGKYYDDIFESNAKFSLTYKWEHMVIMSKRCISHCPRTVLTSKEFMYGEEKVLLKSQAYGELAASFLLGSYICGVTFDNLEGNEVI